MEHHFLSYPRIHTANGASAMRSMALSVGRAIDIIDSRTYFSCAENIISRDCSFGPSGEILMSDTNTRVQDIDMHAAAIPINRVVVVSAPFGIDSVQTPAISWRSCFVCSSLLQLRNLDHFFHFLLVRRDEYRQARLHKLHLTFVLFNELLEIVSGAMQFNKANAALTRMTLSYAAGMSRSVLAKFVFL